MQSNAMLCNANLIGMLCNEIFDVVVKAYIAMSVHVNVVQLTVNAMYCHAM